MKLLILITLNVFRQECPKIRQLAGCVDPHGRPARGHLTRTPVSLIPYMKFAKLLAEAGQGDPRHAENLQLRYKQLKKHLKILSSLQGCHLPSFAV